MVDGPGGPGRVPPAGRAGRDGLLAGVVCLVADGAERVLAAGRGARRCSERYTLLVGVSGRVRLAVGEPAGGQPLALGTGRVLLIPPGTPFGPVLPAGAGEGRARVFEVQLSVRLHGLLDAPALYRMPLAYRPSRGSMEKIAQAAKRIVYDLGRARPGFEMAVNSHGLFIVSFLWRETVERGVVASREGEARAADVARLAPVLREIEARCAEPLTLRELADLVHLHPAYFAVWFRQVTGVAPHEYLARYRLQRARALLLATDQTLDQVADATGHADRSHLTRAFRRVMGLTPSQLRRRGDPAAES